MEYIINNKKIWTWAARLTDFYFLFFLFFFDRIFKFQTYTEHFPTRKRSDILLWKASWYSWRKTLWHLLNLNNHARRAVIRHNSVYQIQFSKWFSIFLHIQWSSISKSTDRKTEIHNSLLLNIQIFNKKY